MSPRKIMLVFGWALIGLSLFPCHEVFDDERGRGTRWSYGIPSSPLLLRENLENVPGTAGGSLNASLHQEMGVKLISLSSLAMFAGALLVRAANKLRPSTLPKLPPPAS